MASIKLHIFDFKFSSRKNHLSRKMFNIINSLTSILSYRYDKDSIIVFGPADVLEKLIEGTNCKTVEVRR